jgi:hypothetical protein
MAVLIVETNIITGIDACDNVCQVTFSINEMTPIFKSSGSVILLNT